MKVKNIINQAFVKIVNERVHNLAISKVESNPAYIEVKNNKINLYNELRGLLSDNQERLLEELDDVIATKHSIELEYAYTQGLKDSRMLQKELMHYGVSTK